MAHRKSLVFKILLIDDDQNMNDRLIKLLTGLRVVVENRELVPSIDRLDVELEEREDSKGIWKVTETTLNQLTAFSHSTPYDLVIADFGFVPEVSQRLLWGEDKSRKLTRDDATGKLLTLRDLRSQFEELAHLRQNSRANIFTTSKRVLLRSFASPERMDIFGPVIPNRVLETQSAFPNAAILPIDSRQELFGYDEFLGKYDRDYYRHLVGTYSSRIVETEMLYNALPQVGKSHARRSVFNIAIFAGAVALIGGATQYLSTMGLQLVSQQPNIALGLMAMGFLTLVIGAIALSLAFERCARIAVRWLGPEHEFQ